jgi:hypothetical protein
VSLCVDFQCFAAYLHAGPYRPVTSNFLVFGSKVGSRSRAGGYRGVSDFLKWLEQLAGSKALTLLLACVCIKLLNAQGSISLRDIGPSAPAIVDVVAILSAAFTVLWIGEAINRWWTRRAETKRHRQEARQFLRNLNLYEQNILRSAHQGSFAARMDGHLQVLVHKRLLDAVPGSGDNPVYVFTIPDVVWEEIRTLWPDG